MRKILREILKDLSLVILAFHFTGGISSILIIHTALLQEAECTECLTSDKLNINVISV
jgi:hypothetical protein